MRDVVFECTDNLGIGVKQIVGATGLEGLDIEINSAYK
jgi:hypothetical protein